MIKIYIDADACPVRNETLRVAERHRLETYIVSNGGMRHHENPQVHTVVVADGPDEADRWIADRIEPGDICVTGDIPLAARVIENGGTAIRHNGDTFTEANIGQQLATRDLMADLRASNPFMTGGGGKPFSKKDRSNFLNRLENMVQAARRR
ncbi:YaiI/YqxD family protein [Minwuia sp.]|uniref:YaiI/YqxD family protein n=1 Tax=Minwuia sp. TaxID=2493630 RepID=UPI003A8EC2E4